MPYFKCKGCALRWYSAASEAWCPECGTALGRNDWMLERTPRAQPRGSMRPFAHVQHLPVDERTPA